MLELVGDILNWAAASIVFPLLVLPLAGVVSQKTASSTAAWAGTVASLAGAGMLFVFVTPVLRAVPDTGSVLIFSAVALTLAAAVLLGGGAAKTSRNLAPIFETVTRGVGRAVMWLLLLMALVQFAVVLLRYVFGINEISMQESITYMHGFVFLLAAGYALVTSDHVRVDIFYREAPPKRKAVIDLLGTYFLLFPFCLLILWTASPYVARSWLVTEGSADASGIQGVFILKSLIPAFAILLAMAGFVVAQKAVDTLKGREA
jgi:TRAP-type mannitol/chloroaromatic compound transport system permease small subunit